MNIIPSLAGLSPEKRALLELRLRKKATPVVPPTPDRPEAAGPSPLSFAQESLWFFDQLAPNSPLYNIPQALRLCGTLRIDALQQAFAAVVQRHEALRTRFISVEGKPMQLVSDDVPFGMDVVDLTKLGKEEQLREVERYQNDEATRPFHLSVDLPIRATLLRLSPDEHILLFSIHHIVADAWSLGVFYSELAAFYNGFDRGNASSLPPLNWQYTDFAAVQRKRFDGDAAKRQISYWKQQLGGELSDLQLPTDRPRPSTQTFRGARRYIQFPATLLQAVKDLSRRDNSTVYVTLLAAFQALLHRYTRQHDIIVGSPVGIRSDHHGEKLIGLFLNTVALRTSFSEGISFGELVRRVRENVLGAFANPDVPLERLVEELKIARNPAINPLFQVVFQFLAVPPAPPALDGVRAEMLPMETGTAKFDLTLTLAEDVRGLVGDLEYNTDLFDVETIDRMLGHYRTLLEAAVADPATKVDALSLLTPAENHRVIVEWNDTATVYPRNASIAALFEQQVVATPEAVALAYGNRQMTYRELNTRANQVAHHLQSLGIHPNTLVGVCLERSIELVVALLGILKAGGAYVPLDANYPAERLDHMIQDTATPLVVTTEDLKQKHFMQYRGTTVCLEQLPQATSEAGDKNPVTHATAEDLAYVIYTSGSTGKPKGVAIPQRAVVRLVKNTNYLQFQPTDVFLLFAPVSFDASTLELWGPLLNGGKLVVFPAEFSSLDQLATVLKTQHVTTLWLTAGLFHEMVEEHLEGLRGVRKLLAGGDVLSAACVVKALKQLPHTEIINGYGPTENTTFTCCYSIPREWNKRAVPVGRPISNTQVYILDERLQPVPIGVPGELFTGGDGLAVHYLNAPELTQQKFVSNPFDSGKTRLYRTGDLTRWLPDGNVEFLGRIDQQVKIRGFRVEPGEIETALRQHPSLREALVLPQAEPSGAKHLVAYVVGNSSTPTDTALLRTFLECKLPRHMVPSHIVVIDKFPLTANGKVDRRLLPAPEHKVEAREHYAAARTPAEQKLAAIWGEVLGLQQVGVDDNFFDLGGHSLLAIRILSRLNQAFASNIALSTIFQTPTIAGLAKIISEQKESPVTDAPILPRRSRSLTV